MSFSATEPEAITHYFRRGFRYQSIVLFLNEYHDMAISAFDVKNYGGRT